MAFDLDCPSETNLLPSGHMPASRPLTMRLGPASGIAALAVVVATTLAFTRTPAALTRTTIHLALTEYFAALWVMLRLSPRDWQMQSHRVHLARQLWTWACITFLVHVACAFHFSHGWSHALALEHTRRESGFGEGLYVNYAFIVIWVADVLWWQFSLKSYARRPRCIDVTFHVFMLFIAFNATVVFASGPVRLAGLVATLILAAAFVRRLRKVPGRSTP